MNPLERRPPIVHRLPTTSSQHDVVQVEDVVRFIQLVRRHWFKLASTLVIATLCAGLYYAGSARTYQSESRIMIVRKNPLTVEVMPSVVPQGAEAMSTHIELIKSPWLAARVLDDADLRELETFQEEPAPVWRLLKSLEVVHQRDDDDLRYSDTNILFFRFVGPVASDCPVILNAVIDQYRRHLNETNRVANQDAAALLQDKVAQIQRRLETNELAYEQHRAAIPGYSSREQEIHFARQQIANLDASRVALEVREAEATSRLTALNDLKRHAPSATKLKALLPDAQEAADELTVNELIIPLVAEAQQIIRASRMGASHPRVVALEEQIASIRTLYDKPPADDPRLAVRRSHHHQSSSDSLDAHLLRIEQELKDIESAKASLKQEADRAQEQIGAHLAHEQAEKKRVAEARVRSERFEKDIARDQQLLDALQSQLQRVEIDIVSGAYATTLLAPPSAAVVASPRTALVFAISTFLGFGGGVVLICGAELRERLARMAEPVQTASPEPRLTRTHASSDLACSL